METYSPHQPDSYNSRSTELGSSRTRKLGGKVVKKGRDLKNSFFFRTTGSGETDRETVLDQKVIHGHDQKGCYLIVMFSIQSCILIHTLSLRKRVSCTGHNRKVHPKPGIFLCNPGCVEETHIVPFEDPKVRGKGHLGRTRTSLDLGTILTDSSD